MSFDLVLHHVQLTAPIGAEGAARAFYGGLLGLREIPKPGELAGRGGVWFDLGAVQLHIGVEKNPNNLSPKRHWAFYTPRVGELRRVFGEAGIEIEAGPPLSGVDRLFVRDPFGNRLEFTNDTSGAAQGEVSPPQPS